MKIQHRSVVFACSVCRLFADSGGTKGPQWRGAVNDKSSSRKIWDIHDGIPGAKNPPGNFAASLYGIKRREFQLHYHAGSSVGRELRSVLCWRKKACLILQSRDYRAQPSSSHLTQIFPTALIPVRSIKNAYTLNFFFLSYSGFPTNEVASIHTYTYIYFLLLKNET